MPEQSEPLTLIYFSPTRTTRTIVEEIARGMKIPAASVIDFTKPEIRSKSGYDIGQGPVIIGAPVYAGRIPKDAAAGFKKIQGNGQPAVLVVLYGNREYDDALLELRDIALHCGFNPVSAGAFIGEHSFSSRDIPIAVSRPDESDLEKAFQCGQQIVRELQSWTAPENTEPIQVPGNFPYREGMGNRAFQFIDVNGDCDACGTCVRVCPKEAIDESSNHSTLDDTCVFCCACIKACPQSARTLKDGPIREKALWLCDNCRIRKEPEVYFCKSFD